MSSAAVVIGALRVNFVAKIFRTQLCDVIKPYEQISMYHIGIR